jgi:hypothetical protein
MTPLTVACVFVRGEYPYTPEYVTRLKAMVERWSDRPFEFVCLTDRPWMISDCRTITIPKFDDCFAYWNKVQLFHPERQWQGRVLYLDLDTLIVAPLQPILDVSASFAITEDPHRFGMKTRDYYGRQIVRKFNSSLMLWDGGTHTHLCTDWTPDVAQRLSGDQDWIAEQCPEAFALPRSWFPRLSEVGQPPFADDVKVILSKVPKNHIAAKEQPWFAPLWGRA